MRTLSKRRLLFLSAVLLASLLSVCQSDHRVAHGEDGSSMLDSLFLALKAYAQRLFTIATAAGPRHASIRINNAEEGESTRNSNIRRNTAEAKKEGRRNGVTRRVQQQHAEVDIYEGKLIKGHSRQVYLVHHKQKLPV